MFGFVTPTKATRRGRSVFLSVLEFQSRLIDLLGRKSLTVRYDTMQSLAGILKRGRYTRLTYCLKTAQTKQTKY